MNIRFAPEIAAAAAAHHLDPRLLAAVAAQETGGPGSNSGNNIVGDGGHGHGLFQIDDRFWGFARTAAAMDPAKNAEMGATILSDNLRRYGGNVHEALSAYNAGSPTATGTTTRWGDGSVLGYADSVLRHLRELGGSGGQLAADTRAGSQLEGSLAAAAARLLAPQGFASTLAPPAPLPAPRTWDQLVASGSTESSAADRSIAEIIDAGDVFGPDDDASA